MQLTLAELHKNITVAFYDTDSVFLVLKQIHHMMTDPQKKFQVFLIALIALELVHFKLYGQFFVIYLGSGLLEGEIDVYFK